MTNPFAEYSPPRWVWVVGLLQLVIGAVLLALNFL